MEAGRWEAALDELFDLLDQGKEHPNIRHYIAQCYKQIGVNSYKAQRYDDALADFEDGLWYDDDDIDLQLCLAATCLTMSRYDRAEEIYRKVMETEPNNVQALRELGEIYYLRSDLEGAEILWSQAAALDPDDPALGKKLSTLRKEFSLEESSDIDENLHFKLVYDGGTTSVIGYDILEILDGAYYEIGNRLKIYPKRQVSVSLLTKAAFYDITESPEWSAGWCGGQIKIPIANAKTDALGEILVHEYVHAVLYDHVGNNCPWWFNEGLAQYLSKTEEQIKKALTPPPDNRFSGKMVTRVTSTDVFQMDHGEVTLAYAQALSAFAFLLDAYGETGLQLIIETMSQGIDFERSFELATGDSFEVFENEWGSAG
jgi:tetratricopeptide (TPR) repeat protein